jgi:hypothetical protein
MLAAPGMQRQSSASKNKASELQVTAPPCSAISLELNHVCKQCSVLKLNDAFRSVSFELPECVANTMVSPLTSYYTWRPK